MPPRRYAVLDVFTKTALEGNPLAVVLDTDGLDDDRMQRIAREFGLPETVFVFPPTNPASIARLRIFTPARELPFAGHPTVGTAVLLATRRFAPIEARQTAVIVLEEQVGIVRCGVRLAPDVPGYAEFDAPILAKPAAMTLGDRADIATALGLDPWQIGFENHSVCAFSAGGPFVFVPVADLNALKRVAPEPRLWARAFGTEPRVGAYVYTRETILHDSAFHARMFAPESGIAEDPATGSAAAAFAGVVMRFDGPLDGIHALPIEQGYEMGRPSLIDLELEVRNGELKRVRIGGPAVLVAEGTLYA
jgi:trans-2,3-dihydro-3-hydroxyanthranilate isomerase